MINDARIALLDILEDWYLKGSTMLTSQLPLDGWYDFIDECSFCSPNSAYRKVFEKEIKS